MLRCLDAAEAIGARVLLVHAKHEAAKAWYMRYGFENTVTLAYLVTRVPWRHSNRGLSPADRRVATSTVTMRGGLGMCSGPRRALLSRET